MNCKEKCYFLHLSTTKMNCHENCYFLDLSSRWCKFRFKLNLISKSKMLWRLTFKFRRLFASAFSAILPSVSPWAPQITRILTRFLFSIQRGNLSLKKMFNPMAVVRAKLVTIVSLFSRWLTGLLDLDKDMISTRSCRKNTANKFAVLDREVSLSIP